MDDITQRLTDAVQGKMPITFAMLIDARTEIERLRMAGAREIIAETRFRSAYEWLSTCCNRFKDGDISPEESFARRHLIDLCEQIANNYGYHNGDELEHFRDALQKIATGLEPCSHGWAMHARQIAINALTMLE